MTEEAEAPQGEENETQTDPAESGFFNDPNQDQSVAGQQPEMSSAEREARAVGWKPRDEWKGEVPLNFIDDPQEYLRVNETRQLQGQIKEMRATIEAMSDWRERMDEANAKQRNQELESLKSQLRDAVNAGDQRLVDRIIERRDELQSMPQGKEEKPAKAANQAFDRWVNSPDADWYREAGANPSDQRIAYGQQVAQELLKSGYSDTDPWFYAEISRRVKDQFKRPGQPQVQGGGQRQPAKARAKKVEKWDQLPADVRSQPHVDQMINKLYLRAAGGDRAKARDLYAQDWQHQKEQEKS